MHLFGRWANRPSSAILFLAVGIYLCHTPEGRTEQPATTGPSYGFSPLHNLKYPEGFGHFDYVNPEAPKGGSIRIGRNGTFNSLNLLKYPGHTPLSRHDLPVDFSHYLYDSLLTKSADEPAGFYGLIAKTVEVDPAYRWVRFTLRPDAKWHDGKQITADDVLFTLDTIKTQGQPYYRQVMKTFTAKSTAPAEVTFYSTRPGNRKFVELVGLLPIHPKHYWAKHDVTKTTLKPPLASGPYKVETVTAGRSLRLVRVKDYWGASHPTNVGRHNFDILDLQFYRNNAAVLEAFKAGDLDLRLEADAVAWATNYEGAHFRDGRIKKLSVGAESPGRTISLVFNLRRPFLQNIRVRKALALAYDFERTNFTLFHNLYEPAGSYYGTSDLAATNSMSEGDRALLTPVKSSLPEELFEQPAPSWRQELKVTRARLGDAARLLDEAGYPMKDGSRIDPRTGKALILEVAYTNPRYERVLTHYAKNLDRLGVKLDYPTLEPISASKKVLGHEYDLTFLQSAPDLAAGTAEYLTWSSIKPGHDRAYAFAGAADPALDAAIMAMSRAQDMDSLKTAARAFDRVLRWRVYDIPLWRSDKTWLAYWNKFDRPKSTPKNLLSFVDRWWSRKADQKQSNNEAPPNQKRL